MRAEFVPENLTKVCIEVKKKHPKMDEVMEYQEDAEFNNQIRTWANMPKELMETESSVITMHQVKKITRYLPQNILHVPVRNLNRIVFLRATREIANTLFAQWQDYYQNKDLCFLLYQLCKDKKNLTGDFFQNYQLTAETLMRWLKSENVSYDVGRDCVRIRGERKPFPERMLLFHISPNSRLGRSCSENFLFFCTREDYLDYSDQELKFVLEKYNRQSICLFMHNILTQLEAQDFQTYYFSGCFLRDHYTGNTDSSDYQRFFKEFPAEYELKYRRWQNYILIKDSFAANSEDERLQFWSQYVPYSVNAYRNAVSESLVMEFECYTIVEFTTKTMGPIYIYQKDVFERHIRHYVERKDNQELRHLLFNELSRYYETRIVHNDGWKWMVSGYLIARSIVN